MRDRFENAMEPHFDDERTALSARPVVPLEKINAKMRHRKQWFLGGAFAVAMMLGAATALLASYFRMRNVQNVPVEVSQVDVPAEPMPVAAVAVTPQEANDTEKLIPEENMPQKEPPVKRRAVVIAAAKPDDSVSSPSDTRQISEEDTLHQIRDTMLYDEWQERRARRVWRRERRREERYSNHRDLLNLDEIFEGRRRPNP